jgi:hypothetical protein
MHRDEVVSTVVDMRRQDEEPDQCILPNPRSRLVLFFFLKRGGKSFASFIN